MKTQKEMILNYIAEFGSITNREAMIDIGIGGLRARISELRREGFDIKAISETSKNRYGKDATYNRYYIDEKRIKKNPLKPTTETRDLDIKIH